MKTLEQWLELLERRHPVEIELGLERISVVARRLGIETVANNVVVVGGTNGKGSCVKALETLALASGIMVGTYTSPHLRRYNERVRIQGREVEDSRFCQAFETIEMHRKDTPLTYFEVGTLAALLIMADEGLHLAVLEVGLGGRYDAVNIIDADVSVITSIDLDHTLWLGNDRESIALEKAGIARPGKPIVCVDQAPPKSLVAHLASTGALPSYLGNDIRYRADTSDFFLEINRQDGTRLTYHKLPLPGLPIFSVIAAIKVLDCLNIRLPAADLGHAMASLDLAGRYQRIRYKNRQIVLDVAHNPAAAAYLAEKLRSEPRPLHGVVAVMADKDVEGFVDRLADTFEHWFVGSLRNVERSLKGEKLSQLLDRKRLPNSLSDTIEEAFERALSNTSDEKTLVVCGSFFTISAIMNYLEMHNDL